MTKESIKGKCQKIWLRALNGENVTLRFEGKTEMHRARFALYDAVRKGEGDIARAKNEVEISANHQALSLTIRRRDMNPANINLENQLDKVLGNQDECMNANAEISNGPLKREDLEESMKRFQEKLNEEGRPGTPYFKREE